MLNQSWSLGEAESHFPKTPDHPLALTGKIVREQYISDMRQSPAPVTSRLYLALPTGVPVYHRCP